MGAKLRVYDEISIWFIAVERSTKQRPDSWDKLGSSGTVEYLARSEISASLPTRKLSAASADWEPKTIEMADHML